MKIALAADHAGFELKKKLLIYVKSLGYQTMDLGTYSSKRTDYPIYGEAIGKVVANGQCDLGIAICGTGVGMSVATNKINGIRAALCNEPYTARKAREDDNANIIVLGARVIGLEMAQVIVTTWLDARFKKGRYQVRINELKNIEKNNFKC